MHRDSVSFSSFFIVSVVLIIAAHTGFGAVFVVNTASDSGSGSLRDIITQVNAQTSGDHEIAFAASSYIITLSSALPALTYAGGSVSINGSGAVLNGSSLSGAEAGLSFQGGAVFLESIDIINFPSHGLIIEASGSRVSQCNIGTRGSTDLGNGGHGIFIANAQNVTIGGTQGGNTISGNDMCGIHVFLCEGVVITGNNIGLNSFSRAALGNSEHGIYLLASNECQIGTSLSADQNYIGANGITGILLNAANDNTIQGNFIGISLLQESQANGAAGINVTNSQRNTIGGEAAGAGNVISGNIGSGVEITTLALSTTVSGNRIGTNESGTQAVPNGFAGIYIAGGTETTIGGGDPGAGNLISGNTQAGILIQSVTTGNVIQGNYIGTNLTGQASIPNSYGVFFERTSGNLLGGNGPEEGNLISGNASYGIRMDGTSEQACSLNTVAGNQIGMAAAGALALANGAGGILLQDAEMNTIGESESGRGNIISGNAGSGISISGIFATGNLIMGNMIGLTADGNVSLPNVGDGITIESADNVVGGASEGQGNTISGNSMFGIQINGASATGNLIMGNLVGMDTLGTAALPNVLGGVVIQNASNNAIGSADAGAGNIISGNTGDGVHILGAGETTENNTIKGNIIGYALGDEKTGAANSGAGIRISGTASGNSIGGANSGEANTISYNLNGGIRCGSETTHNAFRRNSIYGNSGGGIILDSGANDDITAPQLIVIGEVTTGYAPPNSLVELFADHGGQGQIYIASATTSGSGDFWANTDLYAYSGMNMKATSTDSLGNTSEFSESALIPEVPVEMSITRDTPTVYFPNQIIEITVHLDYWGSGTLSTLGVLESPPSGWQFREYLSGPAPETQPPMMAINTFSFTWDPAGITFPMTFSYSVYVPQIQTGQVSYTGIAGYRTGIPEIQTDPFESLIPEGFPEVQMLRQVAPAYSAGSTFDITLQFNYPTGMPAISVFGLEEIAPSGWTFVGLLGGALPSNAPSVGTEGGFIFSYPSGEVPAFPFEFSYRVQIPASQEGVASFTGHVEFRLLGVDRTYLSEIVLSEVQAANDEGEGEGEGGMEFHSADQNANGQISLSELLRAIQFYNFVGYHCQTGTEDGYAPGPGDQSCSPHASDYNPQNWLINLSELLRLIQFFNAGGYHACPDAVPPTEDGYCVGL